MYAKVCVVGAALKRKGKGEDVTEEHMDSVVRAHNSKHRLQPVQACSMLAASASAANVIHPEYSHCNIPSQQCMLQYRALNLHQYAVLRILRCLQL